MTIIRLPKNTTIRNVTHDQQSWHDFRLSEPTTVNATLLPPSHIRIGTIAKSDGEVRPLKSEHSKYVRTEINQRYGTTDLHDLMDRGVTTVKGHDIMIELRPWMAWWRADGETMSCELAGPIDQYVTAVLVAVESIVEPDADHHRLTVMSEGTALKVARREVLGVVPEGAGFLLKLEVNDAARHGWVA